MRDIPFYSLSAQHEGIRSDLLKAMESVVDGNWFLLGERLKDFEHSFADFIGVRHCAAVSTGLDALALSLKAIGVGPGDEVIVPTHTFIATWFAVSSVGAKPVAVESDWSSFNVDPNKIESAVTSKTRAIIPVHLYGLPCDMSAIGQVAEVHGLRIIEDNAQAHGAMHKGRLTGSFGEINATSFYPAKNLGALGDGGAITTNDAELCDRVKLLRNYGSDAKYIHRTIGTNSRLSEIQAAILNVKLKSLPRWNSERATLANHYLENLKGVGDLVLPAVPSGDVHVFHLFVIRTSKRDALMHHLVANGVETLIHYPVPSHMQEAYRDLGYRRGSFPVAERIADQCLSLPLWPGMEVSQVSQVCDVIRNYFH